MQDTGAPNVLANFLDPGSVLDQTKITSGSRVVDFGTGAGHFSLEAARRVGDTGAVWAVDVLASSLEAVEGMAKVRGLRNVVCVRANLEKENTEKIPSDFFDAVIAKDMLFQNKDKRAVLREARRVLSSSGELVVVEWNDCRRTVGPDISLRIAEESLRKLIEEEGFVIQKTLSAGDYHYAFLAEKRGH